MTTSSPEPGILLCPIGRENFYRVVALSVADDQRRFVAPNDYSIAEAYIEPTWRPLAIQCGDEITGFAMYGLEESTGRWWIIRLMIDQRLQGRGYGRAAARELIRLIVDREHPDSITLSYDPDNRGAAALYHSLGFRETVEIDGGEVVARLELPASG